MRINMVTLLFFNCSLSKVTEDSLDCLDLMVTLGLMDSLVLMDHQVSSMFQYCIFTTTQ